MILERVLLCQVMDSYIFYYYLVLVGAISGGVMGCLTGQPSLTIAIAKSGLFFPLITANTIRIHNLIHTFSG